MPSSSIAQLSSNFNPVVVIVLSSYSTRQLPHAVCCGWSGRGGGRNGCGHCVSGSAQRPPVSSTPPRTRQVALHPISLSLSLCLTLSPLLEVLASPFVCVHPSGENIALQWKSNATSEGVVLAWMSTSTWLYSPVCAVLFAAVCRLVPRLVMRIEDGCNVPSSQVLRFFLYFFVLLLFKIHCGSH